MEPPTQTLSAAELLALWETARPQHRLDRALTILAAATPGASRDFLADLSIGERDARLLQLRALILGSRAEGFTECPRCSVRIEFPFDTAAFAPPEERAPAHSDSGIRPVTSRDLAAVVAAPDEKEALRILLRRCAGTDSPNESAEALSEQILAADPQAEITLQLHCPACAHRWGLLFDIADFFWMEISAQAQRLLREIDALARAYGWTESEILRLPAQRRQTYLELIAA